MSSEDCFHCFPQICTKADTIKGNYLLKYFYENIFRHGNLPGGLWSSFSHYPLIQRLHIEISILDFDQKWALRSCGVLESLDFLSSVIIGWLYHLSSIIMHIYYLFYTHICIWYSEGTDALVMCKSCVGELVHTWQSLLRSSTLASGGEWVAHFSPLVKLLGDCAKAEGKWAAFSFCNWTHY